MKHYFGLFIFLSCLSIQAGEHQNRSATEPSQKELQELQRIFDIEEDLFTNSFNFIKNGVNKSDGDYTPLCMAALRNKEELVGLLLQAGASTSITSRWDETPLFLAFEHASDNVIKMLIAKSSKDDVNQPGNNGWWTCLIMAAARNKPELVKLLLEKGADTEAQHLGRTALLWVLDEEDHSNIFDVVQLLVKYGANVNARNSNVLYFFDVGDSKPDKTDLERVKELKDTILEYNKDVTSKLVDAQLCACVFKKELILRTDISALEKAKYRGNQRVIDLLKEHGAQEYY